MKKSLKLLFISIFILSTHFSHADILADSNTIFNWAEEEFPQFFSPTPQTTLFVDPWYYRYYSNTGNYVGVNRDEEMVYVLGASTNNTVLRIASVDELLPLTLLNTGNNPNTSTNCVSLPLIATGSHYILNTTANDTNFTSDVTHNLVSNTTSEETIISQGTTLRINQHYTINNNIISINNISSQTSISGFEVTTQTVFSPEKTAIAYQYCTGQTHRDESNATISTITAFGSNASQLNTISIRTINAINESITTPAGTFLTIKSTDEYTTNGESGTTILWLDQATGIPVQQKNYNSLGILTNHIEVISF
jgi:hypothetical protein